ncbi:MAG: hypothetical protein K9W44_16285 [Candidatus Lokiarchaeota archaeon]|nr:hypothetical protein [Candidatus Harpocratesius repetitus]
MDRNHKIISQLEEDLISENLEILKCLKLGQLVAKHYNDIEMEFWIKDEIF